MEFMMGADMALLELLEASRECSKQAPFLALAGRDTGWPIAGLSVSAWPEILSASAPRWHGRSQQYGRSPMQVGSIPTRNALFTILGMVASRHYPCWLTWDGALEYITYKLAFCCGYTVPYHFFRNCGLRSTSTEVLYAIYPLQPFILPPASPMVSCQIATVPRGPCKNSVNRTLYESSVKLSVLLPPSFEPTYSFVPPVYRLRTKYGQPAYILNMLPIHSAFGKPLILYARDVKHFQVPLPDSHSWTYTPALRAQRRHFAGIGKIGGRDKIEANRRVQAEQRRQGVRRSAQLRAYRVRVHIRERLSRMLACAVDRIQNGSTSQQAASCQLERQDGAARPRPPNRRRIAAKNLPTECRWPQNAQLKTHAMRKQE
ncbi:hypothetical protein DFH94DRAFT_683700 [Russula ochroleuca]|uniref:Uncharacterized protein n=1 Tax=Russula ochroleuca TaxID=152965 RepID=A0A9P5MRQ5_9AGAM|nr:hypothetical protein DFH94DRAFT_683700 [Russula ochroleuca]